MDMRLAFRRGNDLIARAARAAPDERVGFICECVDESCLRTVPLRPDEFARLTAGGDRFVVLPGHEDLDSENLVEEGPGCSIVEPWCEVDSEEPSLRAG